LAWAYRVCVAWLAPASGVGAGLKEVLDVAAMGDERQGDRASRPARRPNGRRACANGWSARASTGSRSPTTARTTRAAVVVSPSLIFGLVPREADRYAALRDRAPDARAGVFFVYRLPP
jgi:hypothetical protein